MISRRALFARAAGAVFGLALVDDPERLLWTPGKTISIPAPRLPFLNMRYDRATDRITYTELVPGWLIAPIDLSAIRKTLRPPSIFG